MPKCRWQTPLALPVWPTLPTCWPAVDPDAGLDPGLDLAQVRAVVAHPVVAEQRHRQPAVERPVRLTLHVLVLAADLEHHAAGRGDHRLAAVGEDVGRRVFPVGRVEGDVARPSPGRRTPLAFGGVAAGFFARRLCVGVAGGGRARARPSAGRRGSAPARPRSGDGSTNCGVGAATGAPPGVPQAASDSTATVRTERVRRETTAPSWQKSSSRADRPLVDRLAAARGARREGDRAWPSGNGSWPAAAPPPPGWLPPPQSAPPGDAAPAVPPRPSYREPHPITTGAAAGRRRALTLVWFALFGSTRP